MTDKTQSLKNEDRIGTTFKYRDFSLRRELTPTETGEPEFMYSLWGRTYLGSNTWELIIESNNEMGIRVLRDKWVSATAKAWEESKSHDDERGII